MPRRPSVVVGTDLTSSQRAVARAAIVARDHGVTLHLVHVTSRLPRTLRSLVSDDASGERRERDALAEVTEELRATGVTARGHLLYGGTASCIRKTAEEVGATLIVLGSRGRPMVDAIIGSTAERVIERSGPPVLLARAPATRGYRNVIVALGVDSDIRRAVDAARFVGTTAAPSLLHVCQGPFDDKLRLEGASGGAMRVYRQTVLREAKERMDARLAEAGVDAGGVRVVYGQPWRVLCREAAKGTLLVLDRGDSRISHALFGSVSRQVIEHCESDVLLV